MAQITVSRSASQRFDDVNWNSHNRSRGSCANTKTVVRVIAETLAVSRVERSQALAKDDETGKPLEQIYKRPGVEPRMERYRESATTGQMSLTDGPSRMVQPRRNESVLDDFTNKR